jgi:hypothetical protein
LYPSCQKRRIEKQQQDAFGDAFGDVPTYMTPLQAHRDQELKEQTDREIEEGRRAAAALCQVAGDGVETDDSLLFVSRPAGLRRNYVDNSNIGRKQYTEVLDSEQPTAKKPAKKPPPTTTCAIQGCTFGTVIQADHKCYNKCGRVLHNMCAQNNDMCDDDNELHMYRSMECKKGYT